MRYSESIDIFTAQHGIVVKHVPLGVVLTCVCGYKPWLGENESKALTEHLFKEARSNFVEDSPENEDARVQEIRTRHAKRAGLPQMNATLADEQRDLDDIAFLLSLVKSSEEETS